MRNRFYIAIMLLLIPLAVFAQASGGQIVRTNHKTAETSQSKGIPIQTKIFEVNGIPFTMVKVDGGTFTMGMAKKKAEITGNRDAWPDHKVTLSTYFISNTEVTQELWLAVMDTVPAYYSSFTMCKKPVEVFWNDLIKFIDRLNRKVGKSFRLPTEAEWEFAAKGGNLSRKYKYPGSNRAEDVAWIARNSGAIWEIPHVVAKKRANELGLFDMCGNVYEWCQDWYGEYDASYQINPKGPLDGKFNVQRGGDYICGGDVILPEARSSSRYKARAGIRLVLSEIQSPNISSNQLTPNERTQANSNVTIISQDKLKKYNIVVCSYTSLSDAKQTFQDLNDNGFFSNIYLDSSNTYRVLMYMGTISLNEAKAKRDKAREKYPDAWILKVENGREYRVK